MSRYDVPGGQSQEFELGSRGKVLRNLLGIKTIAEINDVEYGALVQAQYRSYAKIEESTQFSAELICELHREWLGRIYGFAGKYRTANVSKGGVMFSAAAYITSNMKKFEEDFLSRYTPCRAESFEALGHQLAIVHAEFVIIHPFREGNGRLGRWIADLMAMQAGFPGADLGLTSRFESSKRENYMAAMRTAFNRANYDPLATIFSEAVERGTRHFPASMRTQWS